MWRLSGFGDEISPDLNEQIAVLREVGLRSIDVRAVWDRNVMTLTQAELRTIRDSVRSAGMSVCCVGSPIGKVDIHADFEQHRKDFQHALEITQYLDAPFLRIFSFYIPEGDNPTIHRDTVIERLSLLVRDAEGAGITLVHENESRIYGDTPQRCIDLHQSIDSQIFRAIWDPGNYLGNTPRPYAQGFDRMRPFIAGLHVKDAVSATGQIVVAGAGDGQFPETLDALDASDWEGFCSFEPHLAIAGPFGGFSGPEGFQSAVTAFTTLLNERGIAWE